jgi:hypothetical protein
MLSNVRSVSNKLDEVAHLLVEHKPEIAAFTETWLDDSTSDAAVTQSSYKVVRKDRNSHGGGLMVFLSDSLSFAQLDPTLIPSLSSAEAEFLPLYIVTCNLFFILVYHPFWGTSVQHSHTLTVLSELCDYAVLTFPDCKLTICGDFNGLSTLIQPLLDSHILTSVVSSPTRGTATLDLILTDNPLSLGVPVILPPIGRSDHNVILVKSISRPRPKVVVKQYRKASPAARMSFIKHVDSLDWLAITTPHSSLDDATDALLLGLRHLLDFYCPLIKIRARSSDPPWISPRILNLINQRDRAYSERKHLKYVRLKESVIQNIKSARITFIKKASDSKCPKKFWSSINALCGRSSRSTPPISVSTCSSLFNAAFGPASLNADGNVFPTHEQSDSNEQPPTLTASDVLPVLSHLKNSAPGMDGLPPWVFKSCRESLTPAIVDLFNRCISSGDVPQLFKCANITPIPKTANPGPTDFRPISLLPVLSKVLERIVLRKWLIPNVGAELDPLQFAFTPGAGKGTTSALVRIQHEVTSFLDTPGAVRIIQLDFSKAFDSLSHSKILEALCKMGAPTHLLCWLRNYLTDRCQRVCWQGENSEWTFITSGVPQGSVLGPFLFAASINHLRPIHPSRTILVKYADDLTFIHKIRPHELDLSSEEVRQAESDSSQLGLGLNPGKSVVLDCVTSGKILSTLSPITLNSGAVIPSTAHLKVLGITFSNDLTWNHHIHLSLSKARRLIGFLRPLAHAKLSHSQLWYIHTAILRSVLLYAFPAWCNAPPTLWNKIAALERRVEHIIGSPPPIPIIEAAMSQCTTLARRIIKCEAHPLRCIFSWTPRRQSVRINKGGSSVSSHFAKTNRFKNTMTRFA